MDLTKTEAIIYCVIFCIISVFVSCISVSTIYHFYHHKLCKNSAKTHAKHEKYEIHPKIKYSIITGILCNTIQVYTSLIMLIMIVIDPSKYDAMKLAPYFRRIPREGLGKYIYIYITSCTSYFFLEISGH